MAYEFEPHESQSAKATRIILQLEGLQLPDASTRSMDSRRSPYALARTLHTRPGLTQRSVVAYDKGAVYVDTSAPDAIQTNVLRDVVWELDAALLSQGSPATISGAWMGSLPCEVDTRDAWQRILLDESTDVTSRAIGIFENHREAVIGQIIDKTANASGFYA